MAWALGSHHKILIKGNLELRTTTSSLLGGVSWENERQNFFKNLKKYFQVEEIPYFDDYHAETIAGITHQADWLGSAELLEDPNIQWKKLTVNLLKDNGYAIPSIKKNLTFKEIFGFSPRQIQQDFIDAISAPGVYILEAPMGIGKTEAALYVPGDGRLRKSKTAGRDRHAHTGIQNCQSCQNHAERLRQNSWNG